MKKLKQLIYGVIDKLPINTQEKNQTVDEITNIINNYNSEDQNQPQKKKNPKFIAGAVSIFLLAAASMWGWSLFVAMEQSNKPLQLTMKEKIEVPKEYYKGEKLLTGDLDGDGSIEVIGLDSPNIFILNTLENNYQLRWYGTPLNYGSKVTMWGSELADINGDGKDELLLGIRVPQIRKNYYLLQIYHWVDNKLELLEEKELIGPQNSMIVAGVNGERALYLLGNSKPSSETKVQKWLWQNGGLELQDSSIAFPKDSEIIDIGRYSPYKPELLIAKSKSLHYIYPDSLKYYSTQHLGNIKETFLKDMDKDGFEELIVLLDNKVQVLKWKNKWEAIQEYAVKAEKIWITDLNNDGNYEILMYNDMIQVLDTATSISTSIPIPKGFKGIIDGPNVQRLYGADSDGVYIYQIQDNEVKLVWQGLNFSQTKFANGIDLDNDGLIELITARGDVFAKKNGKYRFVDRKENIQDFNWQLDLDRDGVSEFVAINDDKIFIYQWENNKFELILEQSLSGKILDVSFANIDLQNNMGIIVAIQGDNQFYFEAYKFDKQSIGKVWELAPELSFEEFVWFGFIEKSGEKGKIIVSLKSKDSFINKVIEYKNEKILAITNLSEKVILPESPIIGKFRKNKVFMVGKKKLTMDPVLSYLSVEGKDEFRVTDQVLLEINSPITNFMALDIDGDGALEVVVSSGSNDLFIYKEE